MRNINKIIIKAIYLRVLPVILVMYTCILVDLYTAGSLSPDLSPSSVANLKTAILAAIAVMIPMIYLGYQAFKSECDK